MKQRFISLLFLVPFLCGHGQLHADDHHSTQVEWSLDEESSLVSLEKDLPEEFGEPLVARSIFLKHETRSHAQLPPFYPLCYHEIDKFFCVRNPKMAQQTAYAKTEPLILLEEGTYLRLTDGSLWQIKKEEEYLLAEWQVGDLISFSRNDGWGKDPHYFCSMYNENVATSIQVQLKTCGDPSLKQASTDRIKQVSDNKITLNRGTCWSFGTLRSLQDWEQDDIIVIGINRSFISRPLVSNVIINLTKSQTYEGSWIP